MPNKFFNFLEDESANMGMVEREDPVVIQPSDTPLEENAPEEIEMLDFEVPSATPPIIKDMTIANNLVDELVVNIRNNNYNTTIDREDLEKEIKYIITVKKED